MVVGEQETKHRLSLILHTKVINQGNKGVKCIGNYELTTYTKHNASAQ